MNYLKQNLTNAQKPENLLKRQNQLNKKILTEGASALNFENVCRLCYGNEAVDLWKHKEAAQAREEYKAEQQADEQRGN